MFTKLVFTALAAVGVASAVSIPSEALENGALEIGIAYHGLGSDIHAAGPKGQGGEAVITSYSSIINGAAAGLPPKDGKPFPKAIQFALCAAQTAGAIQILDVLALFQSNKAAFTASQVQEIGQLIQEDQQVDKDFVLAYAGYVPECAEAIYVNGNTTQTAYSAAADAYGA